MKQTGNGRNKRAAGTRALTAVWLVALSLGAVSGCEGRPRSLASTPALPAVGGEDQLVVFDLEAPLPETQVSGFFPAPPHSTYAGFLRNVLRVRDDASVKGALLRLGVSGHNWAHVEELGRAFRSLRDANKPVVCHADSLDNGTLWLAATACEQVWLSPAGTVESVGIAGQAVYLGGLLDRFKVQTDFLHTGRYKSAAETLTRKGPSEAAKESMHFVLDSLRAAWLSGIEASRSDPEARGAAENGPWSPEVAKAIGLIDGVGYEVDAREALSKATAVDHFVSPQKARSEEESAAELAELLRLLSGSSGLSKPHVAVLPAQGGITLRPEGLFAEEGISAQSLTQVIRRLKHDNHAKAVVLRIDSPGGSALASDLLWHELRELGKRKPLIASVGSMAASGGYYMAVAARAIVAEQTSIVGSIGVVGGKIVLDEALAQYGIFAHTFAASDAPDAGARATYASPFTPWDEATRDKMQRQMEATYDLFLDRVSQGRGAPVDDLRPIAEGRIWTGSQGKERGLVDEIGGLERALEIARSEAGLPADAPITIEGGTETLLDLLGLGEEADEDQIRQAVERRLRAVRPAWWKQLSSRQRSYLQSLAPLLNREEILAAMPFAFDPE